MRERLLQISPHQELIERFTLEPKRLENLRAKLLRKDLRRKKLRAGKFRKYGPQRIARRNPIIVSMAKEAVDTNGFRRGSADNDALAAEAEGTSVRYFHHCESRDLPGKFGII